MSDELKKRSEAERVRLLHSTRRLRGLIDSIDRAVDLGGPIGLDIAQALLLGASEVALQITRHDAFDMYEQDVKNRSQPRPKPCGKVFANAGPGIRFPKPKTCSEATPCLSCSASISQWEGAQKQKSF